MANGTDKQRRMRRLWDLQEGCCAHCNRSMAHPDECRANGRSEHSQAPTIDHVKPKAMGGGDGLNNVVLAHRRCNGSRGMSQAYGRILNVLERNLAKLRAEGYPC